jgi:hypothetical protein
MKNTITEKAEKIKTIVEESASKSREVMQDIISLNSRYLDQALDSNKAIVDKLREQIEGPDKDSPILENIRKAFGKSVELSEETIDSILDSYNKQLKLSQDHTTRILEALKETTLNGQDRKVADKLMKMVQENFEETLKMLESNRASLIDSYNKHINLALNFNQKFGESITAQMDVYQELQTKSFEAFGSMVTEWWKLPDNKKQQSV